MTLITIHWDPAQLSQQMSDLAKNQVPYALSRTLNAAALAFRNAEREHVRGAFTIRRDWVVAGVAIQHLCHKTDAPMYVQVGIESDRGFLDKYEAGGTQTPRGSHLAIPIEARPSKYATIPSEMRPRKLGLTEHTTQSGATQVKGQLRTFLINLSDGSPAIMQRTGAGPANVRLLFTLKTSNPTPAILGFESTARGMIVDKLQADFQRFFAEAIATAR